MMLVMTLNATCLLLVYPFYINWLLCNTDPVTDVLFLSGHLDDRGLHRTKIVSVRLVKQTSAVVYSQKLIPEQINRICSNAAHVARL